MVSSPQKRETQAFAGPGLLKNQMSVGTSFLAIPRRLVNRLRLLAVIQFRNLVIEGIALAGWPECPWFSRLVDRLTVLAEALAEKSGVRA